MACSARSLSQRSLSQRSLSQRSLSQPSLRFDSWISPLTPALGRANAPLRIRPCRCRGTRILHGRACRAMPRPLLRPKLASPAWPPPTTDLADPAQAGLTASTRPPGVLSAELARPSRGLRVVRDNDSCSPLRGSRRPLLRHGQQRSPRACRCLAAMPERPTERRATTPLRLPPTRHATPPPRASSRPFAPPQMRHGTDGRSPDRRPPPERANPVRSPGSPGCPLSGFTAARRSAIAFNSSLRTSSNEARLPDVSAIGPPRSGLRSCYLRCRGIPPS